MSFLCNLFKVDPKELEWIEYLYTNTFDTASINEILEAVGYTYDDLFTSDGELDLEVIEIGLMQLQFRGHFPEFTINEDITVVDDLINISSNPFYTIEDIGDNEDEYENEEATEYILELVEQLCDIRREWLSGKSQNNTNKNSTNEYKLKRR